MGEGLRAHHAKSARVGFFAAATGLLLDEPSASSSLGFELVASLLDATVYLMEEESSRTRTNRRAFWARFAELNALYLPLDYLQRGLQRAIESQHADVRAILPARVDAAVPVLNDKAACAADAARLMKGARVVVLAEKAGGPFVSFDAYVGAVAAAHAEWAEGELLKMGSLFKKFDVDGDGVFSLSEFAALLDEAKAGLDRQKVEALYRSLDGAVDPAALFRALHTRRRAGGRRGSASDASAADGVSDLAALWEPARRRRLRVSGDLLERRRDAAAYPDVVKVQAPATARAARDGDDQEVPPRQGRAAGRVVESAVIDHSRALTGGRRGGAEARRPRASCGALRGTTVCRHVGHSRPLRIHRSMHLKWKVWPPPQGRRTMHACRDS